MSRRPSRPLNDLLEQYRPGRLLVIGRGAQGLVSEYLRRHPECETTVLDPAAAPSAQLGRFEMAVVSHVLEYFDRDTAQHLIARLRDVHAQRLIIALSTDDSVEASGLGKNDMLALGLVQVGTYENDGRAVNLYGFDIDTYKTTPDWLNADYWANPELFDKCWW